MPADVLNTAHAEVLKLGTASRSSTGRGRQAEEGDDRRDLECLGHVPERARRR
jgi:hypothetical protein